VGKYWRKLRKLVVQKMLHADDTPQRIALGVGIAMLVAFLPLIGFQTVIAIGLAALFRANKAVCIPIVWITNPFTFIPIYSACLSLGRAVTGSGVTADPAEELVGLAQTEVHYFDFQFWVALCDNLVNLGRDMWIGCALVGVPMGVISYFVTRSYVTNYRRHHAKRLERRKLRRARIASARSKVAGSSA
jgi:hypothetical protein